MSLLAKHESAHACNALDAKLSPPDVDNDSIEDLSAAIDMKTSSLNENIDSNDDMSGDNDQSVTPTPDEEC